MVGALGPVVHGTTRQLVTTVTAYGAGSVLGASITALTLSAVGMALQSLSAVPVAWGVLGVSATLVLWQVLGFRVPQSHWQVPEHWRRAMDLDVLAFAYGLLLGLGVFTAVVIAAFWVLVAVTLFVSPATALAGWALYAVVRTIGFAALARNGNAKERTFDLPSRRRILILIGATFALIAALAQMSSITQGG